MVTSVLDLEKHPEEKGEACLPFCKINCIRVPSGNNLPPGLPVVGVISPRV